MTVTEEELKAAAVAPRVTREDVQEAIAHEKFIYDGTLTICILTLTNGIKLTGESACASPANYNKEIGDRLAREQAIGKIWPLLGYELKSKLTKIEKAGPPSGNILHLGSPVTYLGTKVVHAVAMTRAAYNLYRGWELPKDENGDDNGYLVEYADGGAPNVKGHTGYVSWSPREVFEKAYDTGIRQQPSTFLDRLRIELVELNEKFEKLQAFIHGPAFDKIPDLEQQDLQNQATHMHNYLSVLIRRVERNSQ